MLAIVRVGGSVRVPRVLPSLGYACWSGNAANGGTRRTRSGGDRSVCDVSAGAARAIASAAATIAAELRATAANVVGVAPAEQAPPPFRALRTRRRRQNAAAGPESSVIRVGSPPTDRQSNSNWGAQIARSGRIFVPDGVFSGDKKRLILGAIVSCAEKRSNGGGVGHAPTS